MSAVHIHKNNFDREVMQSDRPVLLDFWAPWCAPCRMIMPSIETIAKERHDIKVGKINIDEEPELASRYGVMTIPTLLVIKNGEIANHAVGARSKQAIENLL